MFFLTTQFHGFLYMEDGGKKTKWFWFVLTLLSATLCVNDFAHLVIVYYGEPTNININIKVSGESPFKSPTLCMEMAQILGRREGWTPVEQLTSEIDTVINMTKGYGMSVKINRYVLTYTYLLLGVLNKAELHHTGQPNGNADLYETVWARRDGSELVITSLLNYYLHKRVSFTALKRVAAAAICSQHFGQFLQYRHPGDKHPQILPLCKPQMITFMGNSLICTKLFQSDTVPTNSSTPYKTFAITGTNLFTTEKQWFDLDKELQYFGGVTLSGTDIFWVKYLWYLDFEGRPSLPAVRSTNIVSWSPMKFLKVNVAVNRRVQMYNRNSRKCSVSNDQYGCEWQKRAARMARSCNCWPSTLLHISKPVGSNMRDCYTTVRSADIMSNNFTYQQCGQNNSYPVDVENNCLADCTQFSYGATKHSLGNIGDYNNQFDYNKVGYLELQFQSDGNSLDITETPATSWSSFLWSFGGSMGTWLGGSILALLYIPFYIAKKLSELWQRKKKLSLLTQGKINMIEKY